MTSTDGHIELKLLNNYGSEISGSNSSTNHEQSGRCSDKQTLVSCTNDDGGTKRDQQRKRKVREQRVKRFDDLYGEVCAELKKNGKSIDLCEKLKTCGQLSSGRAVADEEENDEGDLKRIQLVISYSPSILSKFTNSIEEFYDGKDEWRAKELLLLAESMGNEENDKAIKVLNNALLLAPVQQHGMKRSGQDWNGKLTHDKLCLEWFLGIATPQEQQQPQQEAEQEARSVQDHESSNHRAKDKLLAEIYRERARRFNYTGDHVSCILDIFTSIYHGAEKTFEMVYGLATNYKELGRLSQANRILHHSIDMLRVSAWTNQRKSELTLQIVKQLKEIKSMNRTDDDGGNGSRARDSGGEINEIAIFMGTKHETDETPRSSHVSREEAQPAFGLSSQKSLSCHQGNSNSNSLESKKLYCGPNRQLIAASEALQLEYNQQFGRHIIAKKTIPPGETLILESPYAWSLYPNVYQDFCQQCCKKAKSWIPCQHCSTVVFCSWECQREAESVHKFECPILKLLLNSAALGEMALLCYRTITNTPLGILVQKQLPKKMVPHKCEVAGASTVEAEKDGSANTIGKENDANGNNCQSQNSSSTNDSTQFAEINKKPEVWRALGLNSAGKLDPRDYSSVLAQTTNNDARPSGDILKRILAAIYLALCLRFTGFFDYHQSSSSKCQFSPATERNLDIDSSMTSRVKTEPRQDEIDDRATAALTDNSTADPTAASQMEMSDMELRITILLFRHLQSTSCNAYGINFVDKAGAKAMHMEVTEIGGCSLPTISLTNHSCNPNVYRYNIGKLCVVKSILEISQGQQILDSYGWFYSSYSKHERQQRLQSNYFFKCECEACINDWPTFSELSDNSQIANYAGTTAKHKSGKDANAQKEVKELDSKFQTYKQWLINEENERIRLHFSSIESTLCRYISALQKLYQFPDKRLVVCQETLKILWNLFAPS